MFNNQSIDKQITVHFKNEIQLSNQREQTTNTHNNMDEFQKYYAG